MADRRERPRHPRFGWQFAVAVVCLLGGVLFGTAHSFADGRDIRPRNVELSSLIEQAQAKVDTAQTSAQQLQDDINAAASSDVVPQVAEELAAAESVAPAAALTAVTGPGLRVSLSDAKRDANGNYPEGVNPDDLVVHQQDVQAVVNALWVGGAEAITIMGQRVIATSAVRCIGNTLLLQGRAYSPPFVIEAIGPAQPMTDAIAAEPGVQLFEQYVQAFDLGFEIETVDTLELPGYDGVVRMTAAQVPQ